MIIFRKNGLFVSIAELCLRQNNTKVTYAHKKGESQCPVQCLLRLCQMSII